MTHQTNESINDEGVCRIAQATPGLLTKYDGNTKRKDLIIKLALLLHETTVCPDSPEYPKSPDSPDSPETHDSHVNRDSPGSLISPDIYDNPNSPVIPS